MEFKDLLLGLAYPFVLVIISGVYAIRIRKVPAGYNEAKRIGFAVYTTLAIWLAQHSTYILQSDHSHAKRDAIYCFFLTLNAVMVLITFFGPKVYIVLFRPKKNNTNAVMAMERGRFDSDANVSFTFSNCIAPFEDTASRKASLSPSAVNSLINKQCGGSCINNQMKTSKASVSTIHNSKKRQTLKTITEPFLDDLKGCKKATRKRRRKSSGGNDQNVQPDEIISFGPNTAISLSEVHKQGSSVLSKISTSI